MEKVDNRTRRAKSIAWFKKEKDSLFFYVLMLAWPVFQFCAFYIFVNFNSVIMAFQKFDLEKGFVFVGLDNFNAIRDFWLRTDTLRAGLVNSLIVFGVSCVIELFALIFSFYIYKKMLGSYFFKLILFFPSIVSGVVLAIIFTNLADVVIPEVVFDLTGKSISGFLSQDNLRFSTNLVFYVLFAFGMRILIFSNNMSRIPDSIVEAAKLDGASSIDEFVKITVPMMMSSIAMFVVFLSASILTNGMGTYSLYGVSAPNNVYTIGYYLSVETMKTTGIQSGYPYLAAFGIILSVVTIPFVFFVRWGLGKITDNDLEY